MTIHLYLKCGSIPRFNNNLQITFIVCNLVTYTLNVIEDEKHRFVKTEKKNVVHNKFKC